MGGYIMCKQAPIFFTAAWSGYCSDSLARLQFLILSHLFQNAIWLVVLVFGLPLLQ